MLSHTDEDVYVFVRQSNSESIENILTHLKDEDYQGWKSVKPKSLLDNCYRTMHCIFNECFSGNSTDCK